MKEKGCVVSKVAIHCHTLPSREREQGGKLSGRRSTLWPVFMSGPGGMEELFDNDRIILIIYVYNS